MKRRLLIEVIWIGIICYLNIVCVHAQRLKLSDDEIFDYIKDSVENRVGFGCYASGTSTEMVSLMRNFMYESRLGLIKRLLQSPNPSAQYLAVIYCEELEKRKQINLSESERVLINGIKQSNSIMGVCSGCTYFRELALVDWFNAREEKEKKFVEGSIEWIRYYIKKCEEWQNDSKK